MANSYTLKPRPNLYDLVMMEGVLNGGGIKPSVERHIYWAEPPHHGEEDLLEKEYPYSKPLDE